MVRGSGQCAVLCSRAGLREAVSCMRFLTALGCVCRYMEAPDHTWRQQAHLAASGEGLTYYDTSSSMPAQAAAASNPSIAKRKRGRPKGPNPLEDPTISEKQARRCA
jgi:hypothetical protein